MTSKIDCLEGYDVVLIPLTEESKQILAEKEYKNNKSIAKMWSESL